jgi:hypothetical protein
MAAMENPKIRASVVEATEFPELSDQYNVSSVPQTVVQGTKQVIFVGKYPEGAFVDELFKAIS